MPLVYRMQMTCPECHATIHGQIEHQVISHNNVPLLQRYWIDKHLRTCPAAEWEVLDQPPYLRLKKRHDKAPELQGYQLDGEYGQQQAEHPDRLIFTARR